MLYQNYETEVSIRNLREITDILQQPQCLLGGWAVYLTVNKNFKRENGRNYQGSRDIDLGFHINENANADSIENSLLYKTIEVLEKNGFTAISQRYAKCYHTETKKELSLEESKKIPMSFLFYHYIDPIVDYQHPLLIELCGFTAIDEPLLKEVFERQRYRIMKFEGFEFMIPNPEILLGCKINSVNNRSKEDKKIKDIADIYALIWYSHVKSITIKNRLLKIIDRDKIQLTLSSFTNEDYEKASNAIGIDERTMKLVVESFLI